MPTLVATATAASLSAKPLPPQLSVASTGKPDAAVPYGGWVYNTGSYGG